MAKLPDPRTCGGIDPVARLVELELETLTDELKTYSDRSLVMVGCLIDDEGRGSYVAFYPKDLSNNVAAGAAEGLAGVIHELREITRAR